MGCLFLLPCNGVQREHNKELNNGLPILHKVPPKRDYRLRTYRHKAYYSLDRDDGLEHEAVFVALSPHELYERKVTMQELHAAISSLPDKQAKRIYAHFILGMTKQDIARAEGVHEKVVRVAIERGLRRLEKILKNSL